MKFNLIFSLYTLFLFLILIYIIIIILLFIFIANPENERNKKLILDMALHIDGKFFPPDALLAINQLWMRDAGVMQCYARAQEYQLNDSSK